MEPSPVAASSPRVYVPITHPDSPTFAVLQLVGYSDPSPPNLQHAMPVVRTSPSSNWLSRTAGDSSVESPIILTGAAMEASKAGMVEAAAEGDNQSAMPDNISPECSSAENPSPQGSSTGKFLCCDSPSPRGSCVDSSTCSSSYKGLDKKAVCIKPSLMKKSGSVGVSTGSMGVKKCSKVVPAGVTICVSHTEKETIVHTDSSNFREIVHQLTGASGNEGDLLPVTIPSRTRGNVDDAAGCLSKHDVTNRGHDLGPRRSMPTKLFERRRSSKTLERISTGCRDLPPLVPSPITPLASDFEKICLPGTPIVSPASGQQERNNVQTPPSSALHQIGNVHLNSNHNQSGMYMHANLNRSHSLPESPHSAFGAPQYGALTSCSRQQEPSIEDFVIAEKGFFLHPQKPRVSVPALLPLFPESPRGQ
ncbi:hypothetical protein GOP47_0027848 [Adiantum capillus-veneris]|nr:hypothetical protein GOP47_0027848 [Adiantum capillus-veneris]